MRVSNIVFVVAVLQLGWSYPESDRHSLTIIGGHQIAIEQAGFMASLRLNGTFHMCGGSVIDNQFVLTAAHCLDAKRDYKILAGTDNFYKNGQLVDILERKIHENYDDATHMNDICLLKLKEPLTSPKVKMVNLKDFDVIQYSNENKFNVTGWGRTERNERSPLLLQVEVSKVTEEKCRDYYQKRNQIITTEMMCAGEKGHDSCEGDSGGPLTYGNVQIGVMSFGRKGKCGVGPSVYMRVASYLPWIKKNMK